MNFKEELTITHESFSISNFLPKIGIDDVRNEILSGLSSKQKYISSKFFYDKKGSLLFEDITELDEYYPTRTEKSILYSIDTNICSSFAGKTIVELGSGDCSKISILLGRIPVEHLDSITYFPVDVSQSAIEDSVKCLLRRFPMLQVQGIVADFMHQLNFIPDASERIFCFFGSTLGNFDKDQSVEFLENLSFNMKANDELLLGLDMVKDKAILEAAYNDKKEVTAAFNKNILNGVNRLVETNFNPENFEHIAFYNEKNARIEMHLKALENMEISSPHIEDKIQIQRGEMIHTENSHKFTKEDILNLAVSSGLKIQHIFMDENKWFSLVHFRKQ